jgi:hypothetical protein
VPGLANANYSADSRVTMQWARTLWAAISAPGGVTALNAALTTMANNLPPGAPRHDMRPTHSDGAVTVDADGNACSLVHSINSFPWGTGLFVEGVALNDAALSNVGFYLFDTVAPGQLVPAPAIPTIGVSAVRAHAAASSSSSSLSAPRVRFALSTIGSSAQYAHAQFALGMLGGGLSPSHVFNAPTLFIGPTTGPVLPAPAYLLNATALPQLGFDAHTINELAALTDIAPVQMTLAFAGPDAGDGAALLCSTTTEAEGGSVVCAASSSCYANGLGAALM